LLGIIFLQPLPAEEIPVRHVEGVVHGFLVLRTLEGETLAHGDLEQVVKDAQVINHLTFHFQDGSVHEETTTFSQNGKFRLLRYQLVQKGPSFKHPMQATIDAASGLVTLQTTENGRDQEANKRLELPSDLSNGMAAVLLKNIAPNVSQIMLSHVALLSPPILIKLRISQVGEDTFALGPIHYKAVHYVIKAERRGLKGIAAKLLGKQPSDTHVWILQGDAPLFLQSQGPLYTDGPVWRIKLASPKGAAN